MSAKAVCYRLRADDDLSSSERGAAQKGGGDDAIRTEPRTVRSRTGIIEKRVLRGGLRKRS